MLGAALLEGAGSGCGTREGVLLGDGVHADRGVADGCGVQGGRCRYRQVGTGSGLGEPVPRPGDGVTVARGVVPGVGPAVGEVHTAPEDEPSSRRAWAALSGVWGGVAPSAHLNAGMKDLAQAGKVWLPCSPTTSWSRGCLHPVAASSSQKRTAALAESRSRVPAEM